jgi:hypothetical protein
MIIAKRKKSPKTKTVAALKKELWAVFSLHQKIVHSADGKWCSCYTCDAPIEIGTSNCQGGHCLSKAGCPNLYFDERAVRPQCNRCNSYHGGMHYEFNERLKQEIGLADWQDMYDNRLKLNKRDRGWYYDQIEHYKNQVQQLKQAKVSA